MTSLVQEMERKGDEVRMQVSNRGLLTSTRLQTSSGKGRGERKEGVGGLDEKRDEERRRGSCLEERDGPRDRAGVGGDLSGDMGGSQGWL